MSNPTKVDAQCLTRLAVELPEDEQAAREVLAAEGAPIRVRQARRARTWRGPANFLPTATKLSHQIEAMTR